MIFNVSSGGAATAGSWRFITATAQPVAVAKRTMVAICATAPTTITVADTAPASPASNDVWFQVTNERNGYAYSDGSVPFNCIGVHQYVSSTWTLVSAYYSYLGVWWEILGMPVVGTALENCTWDQINRIGAAEKAEDYFCVGDEKTITLSTEEVITLQILGFNHDNLSPTGTLKAPITFGFKNCMSTRRQTNTSNTNAGGYSSIALYPTINGEIYNSLPADLRAVMKDVNKKTSAGSQSTSIVTTQERLFMLAEIEVFGSAANSVSGEGTRYAYFTNGGSRVKTTNGSADVWRHRSPSKAASDGFCLTTATGTATQYGANGTTGLVLALCV